MQYRSLNFLPSRCMMQLWGWTPLLIYLLDAFFTNSISKLIFQVTYSINIKFTGRVCINLNTELIKWIWIAFEQSLLLTVTAFLVSTLVSPSLENIPRIYNHVAKSQHCQEAGFPIRTKNGLQFAGRLKQLQEKKWGFDQTWYYWYCFDIFQHTKLYPFQSLSRGFILILFLNVHNSASNFSTSTLIPPATQANLPLPEYLGSLILIRIISKKRIPTF